MTGKAKPRTVKAWAVVCASGEVHSVHSRRADARTDRQFCDGIDPVEPCSPHTILTGTFQPARAKKR